MFKWINLLLLSFISNRSLAQANPGFAGLIYSPGEERIRNGLDYPQVGKHAFLWNVQSRAVHIPSWFVHKAALGWRDEYNAASIQWNVSGKDEWGVQTASLAYGRRVLSRTTIGMGSRVEWFRGNLQSVYRFGFDFFTHFSVAKLEGTLLLQNVLAHTSASQTPDRNMATGFWLNYQLNNSQQIGLKWWNELHSAATFALEYSMSIPQGELFLIASTQLNLTFGFTLRTRSLDVAFVAGVGKPYTGQIGLGHAMAL